jgi:cephalosporin-C deacetylase
MLIGMPLVELQSYQPILTKKADFEDFWSNTLKINIDLQPKVTLVREISPIDQFDIFDLTVEGFNREPIKGWFISPKNLSSPQPTMVSYDGYGGGRGNPQEWLYWPSCGFPTIVMDTRGQGGGYRRADTPDGSYPRDSQASGFMTMGILNPETYYYRRVFADAVAFIRAAKQLPNVDSSRIITVGGSQGGGISIAATALSGEVFATMPDVPFLCHYQRAIEMVDTYPYQEIVNYCKIHRSKVLEVMSTLSYFDCMNFASITKAPALFSVGLHDPVCPPETIYAAINHWQGPTEVQVWSFNTHEGGGSDNQLVQAEWIKKKLSQAQS